MKNLLFLDIDMKVAIARLLIIASSILALVSAAPADDKIILPGYPQGFTNRAFGGYL
jgi:hypothetical protein